MGKKKGRDIHPAICHIPHPVSSIPVPFHSQDSRLTPPLVGPGSWEDPFSRGVGREKATPSRPVETTGSESSGLPVSLPSGSSQDPVPPHGPRGCWIIGRIIGWVGGLSVRPRVPAWWDPMVIGIQNADWDGRQGEAASAYIILYLSYHILYK